MLLPTVRSRSQLFRLDGAEPCTADPELLSRIAAALCAPGEAELLFLTAPLIRDKESLSAVLEGLTLLFRDACALRAGASAGCLSGLPDDAAALSRALTRDSLFRLLTLTREAAAAQKRNANAALLVTTLCARLRAAAGR